VWIKILHTRSDMLKILDCVTDSVYILFTVTNRLMIMGDQDYLICR